MSVVRRASAARRPSASLRPIAEALEPRLLYSADLGLDALSGAANVETTPLPALSTTTSSTAARSSGSVELVVMDRRIGPVDSLLADLAAQQAAGRRIDILEIGGDDDGLAALGRALESRHDVSAVHLLGHGSAGVMQLGSSRLDAQALLQQAGAIAAWGDSLSADADLLMYGCDFAADAGGQQLMRDLAALTGADVAASTDLTGAALRGGNWTLEASVGSIEATIVPGQAWQAAFTGTLGTPDETGNTLWLGAVKKDGWNGIDEADDDDALAFQATAFGNSTAGSFVQAFELSDFGSSAKLDDIVRVSRDLVLPGGVQLRAGDLLFTTDAKTTLRGTNTLEVERNDVVLFRPSVAGDYGSGAFSVLIARLGTQTGSPSANDIHGLALVETDTTVGGTVLSAGTFLFTGDGGAGDRDIWAFAPTRITPGSAASGTSTLLVAGSDLGINPKVLGLEIVSQSTAIGGTTLAAGTLLLSLDANDRSIGSNSLSADRGDVIALVLSRTSVGGTAAGTASLLVDGSDVGISEAIDSLALRTMSVNAPPVIGNGAPSATVTVSENTTFVQTVTANDPEGRPLSFSIVGGADAARFTIDATTGLLRFVRAPDFETPLDRGADNIYDVRVQASDGERSATQDLQVRVTNANEAPEFRTDGAFGPVRSVDEGSTDAGRVLAVDVDAGTVLGYQLVGGADAALFTVDAATGALRFVNPPDHERPTDANGDNVYEVTVRASDGTLSAVMAVSVTVRDVNEAPAITSDGGAATVTVQIDEGTAFSRQIVATDPEGGAIRYAIVGGADASRFTIDAATGLLTLRAVPDHEAPTDSDRDNVYEVQVQAHDGALGSALQTLRVGVGNVNEAPRITSDGGAVTASLVVQAGTQAVTHVTAVDADAGTSLTYTITGGADASLFQVDAATGTLRFIAPAATGPGGIDANYTVEVSVSDGALADTQRLVVRVTATNTAPTFTDGAARAVTVDEHTVAVATLSATDAETATLSYAIVGGNDAHLFVLDPATGELRFISAPDAQRPLDADGDNVYEVIVSASDGPLQATQAIAVTVDELNGAPVLSLPTGWIAQEDLTTVLAGITVSDPDAGTGPLTLVLTVGHGRLDIDPTVPGGVTAGGLAGSGTASVILTGSQQQLAATLAGAVRYTANPDYSGPDTLRATLGDNGGSGRGGPIEVQASANLEVRPLSDAPVWVDATRDRIGLEDSPIPLDLSVSVGDLDNAGGAERIVGITVSGLPAGARLVDAQGNVLTVRGGSTTLLPSQLVGLRLIPPTDYAGVIDLDVIATAQDGGAAEASSQVRIHVVVRPVSDAPLGRDVQLDAVEDMPYVFSPADFGFDDPHDTPADALAAVHIQSVPANGTLLLAGQEVLTGQRITASDIAAGRLVYVPPTDGAGVGLGRFTFRVEDSGSTVDGGQILDASVRRVTLDVASVNDSPLVVSHVLVIGQGGSAVPVLQVTDAEQGAEQLVFSVVTASGGQFELAGAPGQAVSAFTLAQVRAGEVRFVQGGGPDAPSYQLQLSDGEDTVITQPDVRFTSAPPPAAIEVPADPPPSTPKPEQVVTRETVAATPAKELAAPLPMSTGGVPNVATADFEAGAPLDAGAVRNAVTIPPPERSLAPAPRTREPAAAENLVELTGVESSSLLSSLLQNEEAARRLDQLRDELARQAEEGQTRAATAMAVTTALSAGYVLWIVRGGVLFGSVLSALPAWQVVDPLPVLAAGRRKRDGDDDVVADDEVERLFGESDAAQAAGEATSRDERKVRA